MKLPPVILVIALSAIVLSGCSKGDALWSDSSVVYYKKSFTSGAIRLFSRNGEIKTAAIINRFWEMDSLSFGYSINNIFKEKGYLDSIRFTDRQHARLSNGFSYSDFSSAYIGKNILFTSTTSGYGISYYEVYTHTLEYYIATHKPAVFNENIQSSTRGLYIFSYTTFPQYLMMIDETKLIEPWITLAIHKDGGINESGYRIQDIPDVNFYKYLGQGDTVLIRQYAVVFDK